ncbi:MAG: DUF5719 family protein [Candidatus Nanopelagicales bacterium]
MSEPLSASEVRRRRLRRPRRSGEAPPPDPRGPMAAGVVLGVVVVLVGLGTVLPAAGEPERASVTTEPVVSSTAVCPEPGSIDGARTTSSMTVVPDLPGQEGDGSASVIYLAGADDSDLVDTGADQPEASLAEPGDSASVVADSRRLPPLEVRTTGSLAPGLVAGQLTQDSYNDNRGLASTACLGPDTSWWFVGGGSSVGRETQLVLVNPEATPAELDVDISGPDGPLATPGLRGLVVEAHSRRVVRLSREAPRQASVAWHVTVRSGRVMAAVSDSQIEGFIPRGADWIPPSADPATRVLIPGIIDGEGGRQLLVHAPGDIDATVKVRLVTEGGSYVPSAMSSVDVPAGTVVAVDLDSALDGQAATLDLQSDVPIVAGVRQRHPGVDSRTGSLEETSFAAGAVLISDIAAAAGLPGERSTAVTLWLTAPGPVQQVLPQGDAATTDTVDDTPVTVTVRVLPFADGTVLPSPDPLTVTVPRDRLVTVDIPRPEGATWFTAVVEPVGGPIVVAHRALKRNPDGSMITGYPWRPLRTSAQVPWAREDAAITLPSAP